MKKVTAYKCEFCEKLLNTYSGMSKHEKKCFYNPSSKSCITCKFLHQAEYIGMLNGKRLSYHEFQICQYKVPDTFHTISDDFESFPELNEEYKYLEDAEFERYCTGKNITLEKLKTECESYIQNLN